MKKLISIAVSLTILIIIYWKIDFPRLIEVFQNSDKLWMTISLGMVIPLTMLTAWRLQQLTPSRTRLGFGEANRLILTASVLNMVVPSKMGDIVKAYFIKERGHLEGSLSLSLVVFENEKASSVAQSQCVILAIGFGIQRSVVRVPVGGALFDIFNVVFRQKAPIGTNFQWV